MRLAAHVHPINLSLWRKYITPNVYLPGDTVANYDLSATFVTIKMSWNTIDAQLWREPAGKYSSDRVSSVGDFTVFLVIFNITATGEQNDKICISFDKSVVGCFFFAGRLFNFYQHRISLLYEILFFNISFLLNIRD